MAIPAWRICLASASPEEQQHQRRLTSLLRNKQRILEARLAAMDEQERQLQSRLQGLQRLPPPQHRLLQKIVASTMQGRTAIVAEVARASPAEKPEGVAQRSQDYVTWGADAISVCTDEEVSPDGVLDLEAVSKAVEVPVLRKDWIIHPIQIIDTRESGAAALTAVYSVLSKGTPSILRYIATAGLDAVVEVVNLKELEELSTLGIPLFGFNISVGVAVPIPGFRQDIAKSLVQKLPFGAASIVGVASMEEARQMKVSGADAVYLKREALSSPQELLESLREGLSGDD
ncbi:uncharacterized protein LOC112346816 [Selaginella moellendorffii]|uniref:uncharacterized protein LOC112346816 n=1 Tax=Selaginella moellendorffii TaxID=88036 RepID=UPI000D1C6934|nr:uncharacterized protein LOC112346816 [Selaginella moellendorffii]|eukprot:XP_024532330.1 uncharacterized protein LOC112346816 [Selaginella moellendorffii]